jgi:hypothetical protein
MLSTKQRPRQDCVGQMSFLKIHYANTWRAIKFCLWSCFVYIYNLSGQTFLYYFCQKEANDCNELSNYLNLKALHKTIQYERKRKIRVTRPALKFEIANYNLITN